MSNDLAKSQGMPFSILFPEVHEMLKDALTRHFHVLQLRSVRILLNVCAEKLTRQIVSLPEHPKRKESPFLNLVDLKGFDEERIDAFIIHWRDSVSMYDDPMIANIVLPKIYEFVRDQVMLKESHKHPWLSQSDLSALSMLLVKNANVFYTGKNWWANRREIERTFGSWFVPA